MGIDPCKGKRIDNSVGDGFPVPREAKRLPYENIRTRFIKIILKTECSRGILFAVIIMEMPQRKPNRIPDYDYNNSGAYFITICTQDRKPILCDIVGDDAHIVPKACGMIAQEAIMEIPHKYPSIFVDRYIVMPDHIHMLLRINVVGEAFRLPQAQDVSVMREGTGDPSPTIGNVIGWYKYQVTKRINELQNTPGTRRFQRSYYDHVIRNQADYNEIWEYIDNNPMKWILTRNGEL